MSVVDFRLRPPYRSLLNLNIWSIAAEFPGRLGFQASPSQGSRSIRDCLSEMDAAGIDVGVVGGRVTPDPEKNATNEDVAQLVQEHERFVGFGAVAAEVGVATRRQVQRVVSDLALRGVTIEPGYENRYADDAVYWGAYEAAEELQVPVVITLSALLGPDPSYSAAGPVAAVAAAFPNLQIVIAHACWPHLHEAFGLAFKYQNVWLMPDVYTHGMPGCESVVQAANTFMGSRLLFGSAYPLMPLKASVDGYLNLPLDSAVQEQIMSGNARRLLGTI